MARDEDNGANAYDLEDLNEMFDQIMAERKAEEDERMKSGLPRSSSPVEHMPGYEAVMDEIRKLIHNKDPQDEFDEEVYSKLKPLFTWIVHTSAILKH